MSNETEIATPVILDVGKQRKKKIKQLKRSEGSLAEEVLQVVAEAAGQDPSVIPVVLVFEQKPKKRRFSPAFRPF
jgi:phenylpyruvate tautomerase PptA (4-oxalocrotonate tautomerase family)